MFLFGRVGGRALTDSLFNSVNLNFLRTEALSFYKVPFVVCFCIRLLLSQDWLLFVQYNGDARSVVFPRRPSCAPQTSPARLFFSSPIHRHATQPQQPVPGGEDATQGKLSDIVTHWIKELLKEGWTTLSSKSPFSPLGSPVNTATFLYTLGFYNLLENACLSSVDSWGSGAFVLRRLPAPYMVLCC